MTASHTPFAAPPARRRSAVLVFYGAMSAAVALGMSVVHFAAAPYQRGKAEWVWALPAAALLSLIPAVVFALTLALLARPHLALPHRRALLVAAAFGATVPAVLLIVKPLVAWLHIGGGLIGGLALSLLGLSLLSALAAAWLASLRAPPA